MHSEHNIKTLVKLLAPKEIGVKLAPLNDMEAVRFSNFWASIFFGILTCILGSVISLISTGYSNTALLVVLLLFLAIFCVLFGVFSFKAHKQISKLYESSQPDFDKFEKDNESFGDEDIHWVGLAYKMKAILKNQVFKQSNRLTQEEFIKKIQRSFPFETDSVALDAMGTMIKSGLVIKIVDEETTYLEFNDGYRPEELVYTMATQQ